MTHSFGPDQREDDVVVLLTLESVHCCNLHSHKHNHYLMNKCTNTHKHLRSVNKASAAKTLCKGNKCLHFSQVEGLCTYFFVFLYFYLFYRE